MGADEQQEATNLALPINELVWFIYRRLFWVLLVALIIAGLAVAHLLLNHRYDVNMALRYEVPRLEAVLAINPESELRIIQGRNFIQKLTEQLYQPMQVTIPFSTRIEYVFERLSGSVTPPPSLMIKSFKKTKRPVGRLEVTYLGAGRFMVRDRQGQRYKGALGKKIISRHFELELGTIGGAPGSVFVLQHQPKSAWFRDIKDNFSLQIAQGAIFSKTPTGLLELHFSTHNPAFGITVLQAVRELYQQMLHTRLSKPIIDRKEQFTKQLADQVKALDAIQTQSKRLLASYGISNFDSASQLIIRELAEINDAIIATVNEQLIAQEQFTNEHPSVSAIKNRLKYLQERREALQAERAALPIQEARYLSLQQKMSGLQRRMELTVQTLVDLESRLQEVDKGIEIVSEPYAEVVIGKATLLKRGLIGAFLGASIMGAFLVFVFVFRYIRCHFYYVVASKLRLPILAQLRIPSSFAYKKSTDAFIKKLMRIQRSFADSSEQLKYLLEAPDSNILFVSHIIGAKDAALITLSSAVYLARNSSKRVCLVDADLSRAYCSRYLKLKNTYGLADILLGKAGYMQALKEIQPGRLDMIAASSVPLNNALLFEDEHFNTMLSHLQKEYDYVIVNMPEVASWAEWYEQSKLRAAVVIHTLLGQKPDDWLRGLCALPRKMHARSLLLFSQRNSWLWRILG